LAFVSQLLAFRQLVIGPRQSVTFASQWICLHQSVVFISYWPSSVSSLGQSFSFASRYSPSICSPHEIFNLRQMSQRSSMSMIFISQQPSSVSSLRQLLAFASQQPSSVNCLHQSVVFIYH
jgi:hypothetical protein